jgi:tetratricopeptide (TPR) repeat protein
LKALAYNRLNDSINARSNYEEYFKRQDADKVGAGDYSSYASILLKFPGNEALAGSYVQKAVELDTVEANKVAYLKSLAQAYDNQKKVREAGYWYSKVLDVKKNYSNVDIYNAGYGYFRAGIYDTAALMFQKYTEKYPEDIFGYYMVAKSYSGMDSTGEKGLAVPSYEKAIAIGEAAADKEKVKNQLIGSYKFFIEYYYNVKKDRATALTYVEKALALDPSDAQLLSNKEFISKNDPKAIKKPTAPKPPAKPKAPSTPKKK